MNTAKEYKGTVKAIAPKVVKAVCSGSDLYQWAWCHGDQVALRRNQEPTPVTLLIIRAPMEENDGVKYFVHLRIEDIEDYTAKKITMFSKVTLAGVATKVTERCVDGKLRYVNYDLKVGKVSVEPCADETVREFDEPIAQVCVCVCVCGSRRQGRGSRGRRIAVPNRPTRGGYCLTQKKHYSVYLSSAFLPRCQQERIPGLIHLVTCLCGVTCLY